MISAAGLQVISYADLRDFAVSNYLRRSITDRLQHEKISPLFLIQFQLRSPIEIAGVRRV
jgi:hypothetical protein